MTPMTLDPSIDRHSMAAQMLGDRRLSDARLGDDGLLNRCGR
jgi:hypothetical protein